MDVLFDRGLLPSYAFPTDLCSFVIPKKGSAYKGEIEQRPQQDKLRALSEYAPGRKLIVNKKTYTVGGVFVEGAGKPDERFQKFFEEARTRFAYCPSCTYVNTDARSEKLGKCPICSATLRYRVVIDPPAFSPKEGTDDAESDTSQSYTTASQAQFPLPLEQEQLKFESGGVHLEKTFKRNQRLVVSNTGQDDGGFLICKKCGSIKPKLDDMVEIGVHKVPFLGANGMSFSCKGTAFEEPIALSHQFSTDLLLVRGHLTFPLVTSLGKQIAGRTGSLGGGLALAASIVIV